jgi:hypothetical protein
MSNKPRSVGDANSCHVPAFYSFQTYAPGGLTTYGHARRPFRPGTKMAFVGP